MWIARVIGSVWATKKEESLEGMKLMVVQRVDLSGPGQTLVAADAVGAGVSELVLVVSGSSARQDPRTQKSPVDALIVGIIDEVEVDQSFLEEGGQSSWTSF